MRPLLSIVIPTKDRPDYAIKAIKACLQDPSTELEVVVQDNSDSLELAHMVRALGDPRVKYRHQPKPVSMSENYCQAAELASGKYVAFIGDDDTIAGEILAVASWADRNGVSAVTTTNPAHYVWPDLQLRDHPHLAPGTLSVRPFTGEATVVNVDAELVKCLASAGQNFFGLPKLYYGLVDRRALEQVKEDSGTYFPGASPDLAAAVALSATVKNAIVIDYPLFIPGSSARSNAGLSGLGRHIGKLEEQRHLDKGHITSWSRLVPKFYSVQTMWAEALVSALTKTGRASRLRDMNLVKLYTECLMWHPRYAMYTLKAMSRGFASTGQNTVLGILRVAGELVLLGMKRGRNLVRRLVAPTSKTGPSARYTSYEATDVSEAVEQLRRHIALNPENCPRLVLSDA